MSQEIQEAVYKQQEVIKDKQLTVKEDLDKVEPAVVEAQNGMCSRSSEVFILLWFPCHCFWCFLSLLCLIYI